MEGLSNSNNANKVYVNIFENLFVVKSIKGYPGAEARINHANVEVYELRFDTLKGSIVDIQLKEFQGKNNQKEEVLNINIKTETSVIILSLRFDSKHSFKFLQTMENIDFIMPVEFQIWKKKKEDGSGFDYDFMIMQNETIVKKKHLNQDMPRFKTFMVNGKPIYDKTDAMNFLKDKLKEVLATLHGNTAKKPAVQEIEKDDLPW